MLLEFKAKNYKSFAEEFIFSMIPVPQSDLKYSILKKEIGKKKYNALCSSVLYGPNAAGKTSVIGAIDVFKSIVLRGNIRNAKNPTRNHAANLLELIPNIQLNEPKPVKFSISFVEDDLYVRYELEFFQKNILDEKKDRHIISEVLYINNELVFLRGVNEKNSITFGKLKNIQNYISESYNNESINNSAINIAQNNLDKEELFLTNGFKAIFSPKLVELILSWFGNKLRIVYNANTIHYRGSQNIDEDNVFKSETNLNDAIKLFGSDSNAIGFIKNEERSEPQLSSIINKKDMKVLLPSEMFESYGTLRFINLFPLIASALKNGVTLIVDEFDSAIHPMALMSIINVFHNDEINKNNAQLIFDTHNPIFLNHNIFRRDEIKFVERDEETHYSRLYSLADFGTSGKDGVRKCDDYMDKYFIGRYGAIKDIDFTSVFEHMLNGSEDGENVEDERN
ncbi:MAG: ATP/GTP-binding protein [Anaerofustis sp.]